jgi:hypothetical protein
LDVRGQRREVALEMTPVGEAIEMGLSLDIIPLPATEVPRAAVEQAVGQGEVAVVLDLAKGEVDPLDIVPSPEVFGSLRG